MTRAARPGAASLAPDRRGHVSAETEISDGAVLHAGAVAFGRHGLLILGPSGSGKTRLALELVALGASLVADDRVRVCGGAEGARLCPVGVLAGLVEIRGAGLLAHPWQAEAVCLLAVRLGARGEGGHGRNARLPEPCTLSLAGHAVALFDYTGGLYPAGLLAMLRTGRPAVASLDEARALVGHV